MNKTIMFLGMLAVSFANAQQEGKVGINTETPAATLNVKSKTGNTKDTKNFELENASGTKLVTVLDNGNVGINKVDPKGTLDVFGTSIFRPRLTTDAVWILSNGSISGASGLVHTQIAPENAKETYTGFKEYTLDTGSSSAIYKLSFIPKLTEINNSKSLLTIEGKSGNVGIGELTRPAEKLHIPEGNIRINDLPTHTGADSDNIVVVDHDGVLKSVDRNSLNNNDEWQYDATTQRVNLKRTASADTKVFYNKNGAYINSNMLNETKSFFNSTANAVQQELPIEYDKLANNLLLKKITPETYLPISRTGNYYTLSMNENSMYIEGTKDDGKNIILTGQSTTLDTAPTNTKNYLQLRGALSRANHYGTGDAKYIIGNYADGRLERGKSTGYVLGGRFTASYATDQSSESQIGVQVFNQVLKTGGGTINKMTDVGTYLSILNEAPLVVKELRRLDLTGGIAPKASLEIGTAIGLNYLGIDATKLNNTTLTNNYGIKLGDIKGAATANYAIHTGEGKVYLGDELEVKSTIKVSDNITDNTCTTEKAGTIRFDATAKKFQGCTGTDWKDLHN